MKKLKMQKALLAICLALPITLKISNAINAMDHNPAPNVIQKAQNSNVEVHQNQTHQNNTLQQTITDGVDTNTIKEPLDDAQIRELLSDYIKGDITKHLAALIQTNFNLIIPPVILLDGETYYTTLLSSMDLYNILYEIPPKSQPGNDTNAIINQTGDIFNLLTDIHKIEQKEEEDLSNEEKILRIMFIDYHATQSREITSIDQLQGLIDDYQKDKSHPADKRHQQLISFLDSVASQLEQEFKHTDPGTEQKQLEQLVKVVRNFSNAYKTKLANPEKYQNKQQHQQHPKKQPSHKQLKPTQPITQEPQKRQQPSQQQQKKQEIQQRLQKLLQTRQNKAKKRGFDKFSEIVPQTTHTQALQIYVDDKKRNSLSAQEYQQFLKDYINNSPVKYLALLIQAKYNFIQFPEQLTLDKKLTYYNIYLMLRNNTHQLLKPIFSNDPNDTTHELEAILTMLPDLYAAPSYTLTDTAKILKIIFTVAHPGLYIEATLNTLQQLLANYTSQGSQEKWIPYNIISKYLGGIATQLNAEAQQLNDETAKNQLNNLAQQIQNFFNAIKDKPLEKQEVKKQSNTKEYTKTSNTRTEAEEKLKKAEERLKKAEDEAEKKRQEEERKRRAEEWTKTEAESTSREKELNSIETYWKKIEKEGMKRLKAERNAQKSIGSTLTHKQALQQALKEQEANYEQNHYWEDKKYYRFLEDYINGNLVTELALIILAKFHCIQFPAQINIDYVTINSKTIHYKLLTTTTDVFIPTKPKQQVSMDNIQEDLKALQLIRTESLPPDLQILQQLFTTKSRWMSRAEQLEKLKELIYNYKRLRRTNEWEPQHKTLRTIIISLLPDIATQVEKAAADFDDITPKAQLLELAQQIQIFYIVYQHIQQEDKETLQKEEEDEEEEGKRQKEEAEKRKREERNTIEQEAKGRRQKKEAEKATKDKEEKERAEKIEDSKEVTNENLNQNKGSNSKISTTQKIINNLSTTNKMLQIIMQILY